MRQGKRCDWRQHYLQCMCALLFLIPFLFNKRGAGPQGAGMRDSWFVICFRVLHACFSLFHFLFNSASEVQMPDMRDSVFVRLNRLLVNCFLFALCCFTYNLPNLLILPNRATKFGFGKIRFDNANSRIFSSVRKFGCNTTVNYCHLFLTNSTTF